MPINRLVLGVAFLTLGLVTTVGRERIAGRHRARGRRNPQPSTVWLVLGGLDALIGVFWIVTAPF